MAKQAVFIFRVGVVMVVSDVVISIVEAGLFFKMRNPLQELVRLFRHPNHACP
ncbi:unnamed protein product [Ectocarpus sp. CCAP 1310/34]|nr:unnamed protein product [Ectocarpus sp. CCAP 1310/34]